MKTSDETLMPCVLQGTPAVMETYVDSKKEVDSHLKRTCEEFILSITQLFVGSLTDFITKVHLTLLCSVVSLTDFITKVHLTLL